MRGLGTASVVVVDNSTDDALPLIKAFSSTGVGAIYLSGDPDEFPPPNTLRGIRLVALDIHLTDTDMPDEQVVRQPVQVLRSILDHDNGPYLVVLWTSKRELAELFREYVKDIEWPPVLTCVLAKDQVRDENGEFSRANSEGNRRTHSGCLSARSDDTLGSDRPRRSIRNTRFVGTRLGYGLDGRSRNRTRHPRPREYTTRGVERSR